MAGSTLAEKLLARAAGVPRAAAGEHHWCRVDMALLTDPTAPQVAAALEQAGAERVFDASRVAVFHDHFVPAKDARAAELARASRRFALDQDLEHFYEVGRAGVCHVALPELGLVLPGDLVLGADSHTTTHGALGAFATGMGATDMAAALALGETWLRVPETVRVELHGRPDSRLVGGKDVALALLGRIGVRGAIYQALEFGGDGVSALSLADRFTISNMSVEAGAKVGLFEADDVALEWLRGRSERAPQGVVLHADADAGYTSRMSLDLSTLEPLVAEPHSPANVRPASELGDVDVDQVLLGSCTNGRIEDFRLALEVLGDCPVHPRVKLIVLPGSPGVLLAMIAEGLAERLVEAGAVIGPCTCGPCIGAPPGVLAGDEVALFTTNRNFPGRSGALGSRVYLAGPAVAAATAVRGKITDPREVLA